MDSESESEGARYYVGHECRAYDCAVYRKISNEIHFLNSVLGSSKRCLSRLSRLSRLTRGCADIDILVWAELCPGHEYANEVGAIVDEEEV